MIRNLFKKIKQKNNNYFLLRKSSKNYKIIKKIKLKI